jgi:L-cystine uptake protein TcyP (sodium:dicarboxylate symporter family)
MMAPTKGFYQMIFMFIASVFAIATLTVLTVIGLVGAALLCSCWPLG